jgi:hypothetical protein
MYASMHEITVNALLESKKLSDAELYAYFNMGGREINSNQYDENSSN